MATFEEKVYISEFNIQPNDSQTSAVQDQASYADLIKAVHTPDFQNNHHK